ncbi:MAG TPA: G1 family glutamic endopeptidase [Acidimicrobiales bacterium]|nr:G1 family glutamic endopeptidase [Acidimicrobiales bacterium]
MKRLLSLLAVLPTLFLFSSVAGAASSAVPQVFHSPINILGIERNNVTSENWSGYAVESPSQFTEVLGSWVQPTAKCTNLGKTYGAFWIGLDGFASSSVEQLGTDSDCKNINSPTYYAWYEMYPAASVTVSPTQFPVKPGDTMTASVTRSSTSYTLSLHSSEGWTFSTTQSGSDANSSAEWVAEAPDTCLLIFCSNAKLTNFGSVTFSGAQAATGGSLEPVSSFTTNSGPHDITMTTSSGTIRAQPGALTAGGEGFSDTWVHN